LFRVDVIIIKKIKPLNLLHELFLDVNKKLVSISKIKAKVLLTLRNFIDFNFVYIYIIILCIFESLIVKKNIILQKLRDKVEIRY